MMDAAALAQREENRSGPPRYRSGQKGDFSWLRSGTRWEEIFGMAGCQLQLSRLIVDGTPVISPRISICPSLLSESVHYRNLPTTSCPLDLPVRFPVQHLDLVSILSFSLSTTPITFHRILC
ncbi:hypothetical protein RRG08_056530 [Elysia crispata]|uniref:Uncharacterized protein n=1 Tax=Elysia crispata TaxID=231223 RepID=A0AAE0ZKU2_9GAST|nr:hypothetical protein RRG08_056530 [Elysia crispata]